MNMKINTILAIILMIASVGISTASISTSQIGNSDVGVCVIGVPSPCNEWYYTYTPIYNELPLIPSVPSFPSYPSYPSDVGTCEYPGHYPCTPDVVVLY